MSRVSKALNVNVSVSLWNRTEFDLDSSDYLVIPVDKDGNPDQEILDNVLQPPMWPMTTTGQKFTFDVSLNDFLELYLYLLRLS